MWRGINPQRSSQLVGSMKFPVKEGPSWKWLLRFMWSCSSCLMPHRAEMSLFYETRFTLQICELNKWWFCIVTFLGGLLVATDNQHFLLYPVLLKICILNLSNKWHNSSSKIVLQKGQRHTKCIFINENWRQVENSYSSYSSWVKLELIFLTVIIWGFQEQIQKDRLQSPPLYMSKYLDWKCLCVFFCGGVSSEGLMLLTTMCTLAPWIPTGSGYRHYHCLEALKFTFIRFLYLLPVLIPG